MSFWKWNQVSISFPEPKQNTLNIKQNSSQETSFQLINNVLPKIEDIQGKLDGYIGGIPSKSLHRGSVMTVARRHMRSVSVEMGGMVVSPNNCISKANSIGRYTSTQVQQIRWLNKFSALYKFQLM